MSVVEKIEIFPSLFMEYDGEEHCILECLTLGGHIKRLRFERKMIEHIADPTYLLIGIMSGRGFIQSIFVDAKDFEELFKKEWKELVH